MGSSYNPPGGAGGSVAWPDITGDIHANADLQDALAEKAAVGRWGFGASDLSSPNGASFTTNTADASTTSAVRFSDGDLASSGWTQIFKRSVSGTLITFQSGSKVFVYRVLSWDGVDKFTLESVKVETHNWSGIYGVTFLPGYRPGIYVNSNFVGENGELYIVASGSLSMGFSSAVDIQCDLRIQGGAVSVSGFSQALNMGDYRITYTPSSGGVSVSRWMRNAVDGTWLNASHGAQVSLPDYVSPGDFTGGDTLSNASVVALSAQVELVTKKLQNLQYSLGRGILPPIED